MPNTRAACRFHRVGSTPPPTSTAVSIVEVVAQDRGLALRCPGGPHRGEEAEPALVLEDDPSVPGPGVFFTLGQRSLTHCSMAASSRSRARRAGRCRLHPIWRSTRQTWPGWYFTPVTRSITSATRASVHSSVGKPLAFGSLLEGPFHFGQIGLAHLGRTTGLAGALQCLLPAGRPLLVPVRNGLMGDLELTADVGLGDPLREQVGSSHPTSLHASEISTRSASRRRLRDARSARTWGRSGHAPIIPLDEALAGYYTKVFSSICSRVISFHHSGSGYRRYGVADINSRFARVKTS